MMRSVDSCCRLGVGLAAIANVFLPKAPPDERLEVLGHRSLIAKAGTVWGQIGGHYEVHLGRDALPQGLPHQTLTKDLKTLDC